MDNCIVSFVKAKPSFTLDANSVYEETKMDNRNVAKTAFMAYSRLCKYCEMPFKLKNDLTSFRWAIDIMKATVKRQYASVYIDGNIIYSEHQKNAHGIIKKLSAYETTLRRR